MKSLLAALAFCLATVTGAADAAGPPLLLVARESRDAAAGFVSTQYFVVHGATKDCVDSGFRKEEWRKDLIESWIASNSDYLRASRAYTRRRFGELDAEIGSEGRRKAESQVLRTVYADSLKASNTLLHGSGDEATCRRLDELVRGGALDIAQSSKLTTELADLLESAKPYVDPDDGGTMPLMLSVLK
jgi:hypothetical protein